MPCRLPITLLIALGLFGQDQPVHITGAGVNFYKLDREIALGAQLASEVRRHSKALDSDVVQDYVGRLGRQLAALVDGPNFTYTFTAIEDGPGGPGDNPTHEPMALPGGAIFIPASLILDAQSTPELAGMLAHAIAHVGSRHCTKSMRRGDLMQLASTGGQSEGCWVGGPMPLGYLAFQQAVERQADYYAVQIMAQAGYDPVALGAYIRRVQGSAPKPRGLSPWPAPEERVKEMQKEIGKLAHGGPYAAGEDIAPVQLALRKP